MNTSLNQFNDNISQTFALVGIYEAITRLTTPIIDPSDILRAAIVMGVSALDQYVHEVIRTGMLDIHAGKRKPTQEFVKFFLSTGRTQQLLNPVDLMNKINRIIKANNYKSFQNPDKIEDALRSIYDNDIWITVTQKKGKTDNSVKETLEFIVMRRNQIAHEADIERVYGTKRPIQYKDTITSLEFIRDIVLDIHDILLKG